VKEVGESKASFFSFSVFTIIFQPKSTPHISMTPEERIKYCKICTNRKMDFSVGLVCGLTLQKPTFEGTCPTFSLDQAEADRLIQRERELAAEAAPSGGGGGFGLEQKGIGKGVVGGIIMIIIAVVWFFAGLAADRIFFYPPVLFCIGLYALIKGMAEGNLAGKK
jgi:hypothetical protein